MRCLLLVAALVAGVSAYIQLEEITYEQLQDVNGGLTLNSSTQNRVAWDDERNILYVVAKEPRRLTAFSVAFAGGLTEVTNHQFTAQDGEVLDVEYCNPGSQGNARVAMSFNHPTNPASAGTVRVYTPLSQANNQLGAPLTDFAVGPQPVDIKFSADCLTLLVANQARPFQEQSGVTDGDGTVTKVVLDLNLESGSQPTVTPIDFEAKIQELGLEYLDSMNFRRSPIRDNNDALLPVTRNVEPVSLEIAPNGLTAYVAMPKNNAIARINLDLNSVVDIFPFGNRSWATFYLDASKGDNAIHMENYRIFSTLQPVQVKWLVQGDTEWMVTLDTGFIDYIPEYNHMDFDTGANLMSSGVISGVDSNLQDKLNDVTRLGQAYISTVDGRSPSGENIVNVFMFGGRGITVHDGQTLDIRTALVDNIERVSAQFYREVFNTGFTNPDNTPQQDREANSPTLGPSLSVLETGFLDEQKLLFLGSGSSGMIYVYVLVPDADCPQPFFHSVYRRGGISSSWQSMYNAGTIGDLGISDMVYIGDSEDHDNLLIVASSTSNSLSVYKVQDNPVDLRRQAEE